MGLVKHSKRTVRRPCRSCGSKDLYWAHDTDRYSDYCTECGVSGKWTLINVDGSRHTDTCPGNGSGGAADSDGPSGSGDDDAPSGDVAGGSDATAKPAAAEDATYNAFKSLMDALAPKVDRNEVASMIKEQLADHVFPTRTVVERASGDKVEVAGSSHHKLADVTTDLLAGEHVLMVGPAGTGKSTVAEQAAEGLGLAFYAISLSPMTPASQILGYMQAEGKYVPSLFRQAYEHGGVFHFDEFDNGHPSVLAVINAALANGAMAFPDSMVKRHPDFRCVASANTYGRGADRAYVGRQQIDAATLDRFAVESIDVDESLESELCHGTGADAATVSDVLTYVRRLRGNAERKGMTVVISPRASVGMCRLLGAGKSWDAAVESRVRRGMSDQDWSKLGG
jgi:cobaltochelatase CobS